MLGHIGHGPEMAPAFFEVAVEDAVFGFAAKEVHQFAAQHAFFPEFPAPAFFAGYEAFFYGVAAVEEQHFVYLDLYGANLAAIAAEA